MYDGLLRLKTTPINTRRDERKTEPMDIGTHKAHFRSGKRVWIPKNKDNLTHRLEGHTMIFVERCDNHPEGKPDEKCNNESDDNFSHSLCLFYVHLQTDYGSNEQKKIVLHSLVQQLMSNFGV
jgi:hypothetical protein